MFNLNLTMNEINEKLAQAKAQWREFCEEKKKQREKEILDLQDREFDSENEDDKEQK